MSRTERFAIIAAVIGLIVDVIALAKFSGFLPAEEAHMNRTGASVFYAIIALILICYSLVIFGVFSLRKIVVKWRSMGIVPSKEAQHASVNVFAYVSVLPIYVLWLFTLYSTGGVPGEIIGLLTVFGFVLLPAFLLFTVLCILIMVNPELENNLQHLSPASLYF